jgi:DNA invertase Pin-like site-specific DNA recombinase
MSPKSKALKVGLYARVSTIDQTVRNQVPELRRYVDQRNWTVAETYVDEGVSGTVATRPALDKLMKDARAGKFDAVIVVRFDRFARSTTHLLAALEEFRRLNIDFISVSECIDTTTPMGKMVFTIVGAVAELERTLIVERVKAGLRRAKDEGKRLGRPRVEVDAAQIAKLRSAGLSIREIAHQVKVSKSTVSLVLKSLPAS